MKLTSNQHIADARASLEARLIAYDQGAAFNAEDARAFARDYVQSLIEHGWAPTRVVEPRQQHNRPADPAKVRDIVSAFHESRTQSLPERVEGDEP